MSKRQWSKVTVKLLQLYSRFFNGYTAVNMQGLQELRRTQTSQIKAGREQSPGLPMALRAWLSSRLNALIGTSSHTGRTATVERLLAGLVTSALAVTLGRLRLEPAGQEAWPVKGESYFI